MDNNLFENDNNNNYDKTNENIPVKPTPPVATQYTPLGSYPYYGTTAETNPTPPVKQTAKKHSLSIVFLSVVLAALIGSASTFGVFVFMNKNDDASLSNPPISSTQLSGETIKNVTIENSVSSLVEAVYEKCAKSVVGIRTTSSVGNFFGGTSEATGEGSGVIYTADGYIITNYHVISDAVSYQNTNIEVFLLNNPNEAINAELIGYNVSTDLAVLKINKTGLSYVEFANSDEIKIGQYAIAIGAPGGLEFMGSVTYGIISGLNRQISLDSIGQMTLIQTDAAINPGNSGGALFNSDGKLVGVNNAKYVDQSIEGMGFSIPSNTVKEIVEDIIQNKDTKQPYVGIEIYSYSSQYLSGYGYPAGAAIKSVVTNGPAYNAGIKSGDVITEFNGMKIAEYTDLIAQIKSCKPGDEVGVKLYRSGKYYTTTINVDSNNG